MSNSQFVSLEFIDPNPFQKQEFVDAAKVQELATSIKQNYVDGLGTVGLLQVPTARLVDGDRYQLAFGHHRYQAFVELAKGNDNFYKMPLIIEGLTDQQMFEAMAGENLQRRDISFIEEADVYHTYMTTFGMTSVECAERFGKTDELVRSRLMMIQLPESAKKAAKEGKINVSVARDLIPVNKLLGAEGVEEALGEIENVRDGSDSRFGAFDSPREAIDSLLSNSKKLMRLDKGAGWFSAKKFPAQYLDKLSDNAVTKAMGITLKGATPQLRDDLKKLIERVAAGKDFADDEFPSFAKDELQKVHVLVNPPACENCPLHASFDGDHYCPFRVCHDRKGGAWQRKELDDKSKAIGIALYTKEDGQTAELSPRDDADCRLVKNKHADLRLMKAQYMYGNFDGIGPVLRVVAVGKTAEKRLGSKQDEVKKADTDQILRQRETQKQQTKKEFVVRFQWEVASDAFAMALDLVTNFNLMAFMLDEVMVYNLDADYPEDLEGPELLDQAREMKKADGLRMVRRIIMHEMLDKRLDNEWRKHNNNSLWDQKQPVIALAKMYATFAEDWGVKLGKGFMSQAETYQAQLDAAIKELNKPQSKA